MFWIIVKLIQENTLEIKYASMIESMDYALGTILNKLKNENILDNTIIIFMSCFSRNF